MPISCRAEMKVEVMVLAEGQPRKVRGLLRGIPVAPWSRYSVRLAVDM